MPLDLSPFGRSQTDSASQAKDGFNHRGKGGSVLQGGVGPSRTESRGPNSDPTFQHPGLQSRVDRYCHRHYPALDGVRALAIVLVVGYHAKTSFFQSGSLGVDIFFVMSGFLITALLLEESDRTGSISLGSFFMRRILRIFPALLGVLSAGTVLQKYLIQNFLGSDPSASLVAGWGMFMDVFEFRFLREFQGLKAGAFSHLWSVHLEEKFYFLWASFLSVALALFRGKRQPFKVLLVGVILGVFVLRVRYSELQLIGSFTSDVLRFLIVTRVDHLLLGCFLGFIVKSEPGSTLFRFSSWVQKRPGSFDAVGMGGIILAAQLPESAISEPLFFGVVLSAAFLVLRSTDHLGSSYGIRFLSSKVCVALGKRSYSVYLWHWFARRCAASFSLGGFAELAVYLGLTAVLSFFSYRWIELPFLRLKNRYRSEGSLFLQMQWHPEKER